MKIIVFLILMISSSVVFGVGIENTKWIMISEECPDAVAFMEDTYIYYNDCYAVDSNGIVETGNYRVEDGYLYLYKRNYRDSGNVTFWDKNLNKIKIIKFKGKELALEINGNEWSYRKSSF